MTTQRPEAAGSLQVSAGGASGGAATCEQLFLEHLSAIKSVVAFIGKRRRLPAHELEEFGAHVYLKLIEDDYAAFRKFEGRSSLRTYLNVVIQRLYLDWRVAQWGKWRPSAVARQNGRIAVLLEQLTGRNGMTFEEACMTLETVHHVTIGVPALEALYARLPRRPRRRYSGDDALRDVAASYGDPMSGLIGEEEETATIQASRALSAELASLAPDDLRLLKLRFAQGLSVTAIARVMSADSKRLYRRIARVLADLRARLQKRGICQSDVLTLLGRTDLKLAGAWASRDETSRWTLGR